MQPLFRSYDHFRSSTSLIAKHLKGTKLAVLREAVAKAHGFKNVSSYQASFALGSSGTIPVDPNIRCEQHEGLVVFQGRVDGLVNLPEDPEVLEAAETLNVSLKQWQALHRGADMRGQIAWEQALEKAWGIRHSKVGVMEIDGVVYARAVSSMEMYGDTEDLADDFTVFLSRQPVYSKALWVFWAVADYLQVNVGHCPDDRYAARMAERYNEDTWDQGLDVRKYFPYEPVPGVVVDMKAIAGLLGWSKIHNGDYETWCSVIADQLPRAYRDYAEAQMLWFDDKQANRAWELDWQNADDELAMQTTGLMVLLAEESLIREATIGLRSDEMTIDRLKEFAGRTMMRYRVMSDLILMRGV